MNETLRHTLKKPSQQLGEAIKHKINFKTKPLGALGVLEELALQICLIQQTDSPILKNPHILVIAADHGIAREGVSAYPQDVTWQMIRNFLSGGAAINVFAAQNNIAIKIVDAGVNYPFESTTPNLIQLKIAKGTASFLNQNAMTAIQCQQALKNGGLLVEQCHLDGCNVIGFGEMGIGNTSSAALIMSLITRIPIAECVGKGAGLDDEGLKQKINVLTQAYNFHCERTDAMDILSSVGGFEIATITGAMLRAAELNMLILVDGFISTAAFIIAHALQKNIIDYAVFCHQSNEQAHKKMLQYLNVAPILNLNMRLGEGTGCAIAYPMLQSAVNFINQMASFETANVSNKH